MLWFKIFFLFLYHQINISSLYINKRKEKNQKYRACIRKCMCTHATSHSGVSVCIVKVIGRYGHGTQSCSFVAPLHGHGNPLQQVVVRQRLSSLHPKTVAQLWFGRQYQQLYQSVRANYNHKESRAANLIIQGDSDGLRSPYHQCCASHWSINFIRSLIYLQKIWVYMKPILYVLRFYVVCIL